MAKKTEAQWIALWEDTWLDSGSKKVIESFIEKPINILSITKDLGANVYQPYLETLLEGWIEYNKDKKVFEIYLNPKYPAIKQRYTLAHELSHFLFHQTAIIEEGQLDRGYSSNKSSFNVREWQANLFASELLVPTSMIEGDMKNNEGLKELSVLTKHIEDTYQVSKPVAIKRAKRAIATYKDKHS